MVTGLGTYRLAGRLSRDLVAALEAAEDLLGLRMLPDDMAARLASFRDDVETALEGRGQR